ncbi:MAG: capsule biosynthesis protein [Planktomarina sp.]
MKPKAKKFRVRGQDAAKAPSPAGAKPEGFVMPTAEDGLQTPDLKRPGQPAAAPGNTIEAIRREGLTGRQLRMARRAAQRNNLPATSDFDAVRLLRERGLDPFAQSNQLELVKSDKNALAKIDPVKLPQTVPDGQNLPSTEVDNEDPAARRAREIQEVQREITKRRQKKMLLLGARLAFFVFLPTLIAGFYFYTMATPMYATKSSFLIQQNDAGATAPGGSGVSGMLGSSPMATLQDSIAVQGYLTSEAAMIRLDEDRGFKSHFSGEHIDALTRLEPEATNADAYKIYKRNVKIGYDPTEGIINMEIIAATPEASVEFSKALVGYAEERVSNLSLRLREDQMKGARESYQEAEDAREAALERMVELQASLEVADPLGVISSIQGQITALETELNTFRIQLAEQLENLRPNQAKVDSLRGQIRRREERIAELQAELTNTGNGELSAAEKQARLRIAEADFETRDMMLQSALQNLEIARVAADRQARYLATSVSPVQPDAAKYPRKFESTVLAFLIFGGIYLMVSLTASVLREQV